MKDVKKNQLLHLLPYILGPKIIKNNSCPSNDNEKTILNFESTYPSRALELKT